MSGRPSTVEDFEAMPRGGAGLLLVPACHRRGVRAAYELGVVSLTCAECGAAVVDVLVARRPKDFLAPKAAPVVP